MVTEWDSTGLSTSFRPSRDRPAPDGLRACTQDTHGPVVQQMRLDVEGVADRRVRLKEALRRCAALEPLHLSLPSSDDEVRILGAIVVAQSAPIMAIAEAQPFKRSTVGA